MKAWQQITAMSLSGITVGIGIVTFFQTLVYSNAKGVAAEGRIERIENKLREDEAMQREDLTHIRDRIDAVYELLFEEKRMRSN